MVKLLGRQGITFNVFSDYSTLNKATSESPILGVNYLGKQIIKKKNSGEEGIDRLAIPKGQYAKLAKATRGKQAYIYVHNILVRMLPVELRWCTR